MACGFLVPGQGLNLCLLHQKLGFLITGPPGKFSSRYNFFNVIFSGKNILSTEAEGDQQLKWELKALCCQMVTPNIRHQRGNTVIHFEVERLWDWNFIPSCCLCDRVLKILRNVRTHKIQQSAYTSYTCALRTWSKRRNVRNIASISRWDIKHIYTSLFSLQITGKWLKKDKNEIKSSAFLKHRWFYRKKNFFNLQKF